MNGVIRSFSSVMLTQCLIERAQRFHFASAVARRRFSGDACHDFVDISEFTLRAPTFVLAAPLRSWFEPDSECFRKVLGWMRLRIPRIEVEYIVATARLRLVPLGVGNSV